MKTPETGTITTTAQILTHEVGVSGHVLEQESIQQTAIKIAGLVEWFKNPGLAQIIWDEMFQHMTHSDFLEHKGPINQDYQAQKAKIDEYPTTIAGRFRHFHEAKEELDATRKDPRKKLTVSEATACIIHPVSGVADKAGRTQPIENAELLALLLNRPDLDHAQKARILDRQKAMGLSKEVVGKANKIQEEIGKVDQPSFTLTEVEAVVSWLKYLQFSPANSSRLDL